MRKRALSVLGGLIASGLLVGVTVAGSAGAASRPGSLDPAFGTGGIAVTNTGTTGVATDAAQLSNGDIVAGSSSGVMRFLPSGQLDQTFGVNGLAQTRFTDFGFGPARVAVQPDGRIVWAGEDTTQVTGGDITDFAVARFNPNGTLDSSFGTDGQASTEFFAPPLIGASELASAVLVQADGKILVGGTATQGQLRHNPEHAALARFNANGALDATFGTGGKVLTAGPGIITALGLDAAGDIFTLPSYAEYSPAGQADATVTPAPITSSSRGGAAAFVPSGQFVVADAAGVTRHDVDVQVQRFNAGGSLASTSPAFDYTGTEGPGSDNPSAVAIQANGQAIVGGSGSGNALARVNVNGSLDSGFGRGGVLTTRIPGSFGPSALLIQSGGKILTVGAGQDNNTGQTLVIMARYIG